MTEKTWNKAMLLVGILIVCLCSPAGYCLLFYFGPIPWLVIDLAGCALIAGSLLTPSKKGEK